MATEKACKKCGVVKPLEEFSPNNTGHTADRLSVKCKDCNAKIRNLSERRNYKAYKPKSFDSSLYSEFMKKKSPYDASQKVVDLPREPHGNGKGKPKDGFDSSLYLSFIRQPMAETN